MTKIDLRNPASSPLIRNIQRSARKHHQSAPSADVLMTFIEAIPRLCRYCRLDEVHLGRLQLRDRFGRPVARHAAMRVDPTGSFAPTNLCWACAPCAIVREVWDDAEAIQIGQRMAQIWIDRLDPASTA